MQNNGYCALGHIDGAEVGVQPTLGGQDILIRHGERGRRLTRLLGDAEPETVMRAGVAFWRVPHTGPVDARLMELTDLFIAIRYAHPSLVQLELELSDE